MASMLSSSIATQNSGRFASVGYSQSSYRGEIETEIKRERGGERGREGERERTVVGLRQWGTASLPTG